MTGLGVRLVEEEKEVEEGETEEIITTKIVEVVEESATVEEDSEIEQGGMIEVVAEDVGDLRSGAEEETEGEGIRAVPTRLAPFPHAPLKTGRLMYSYDSNTEASL
jgi:hypothetical protein